MSNLVSFRREEKPLVGDLFRNLRRRASLTQAQLAAAVGLTSPRMILSWEGSESIPKADRLQKLLEFYLSKKVFASGYELAEARDLWERVKEWFDSDPDRVTPYPSFDEIWFKILYEQAVKPTLAVVPPPAAPAVKGNLLRNSDLLIGRVLELAQLERLLAQPNIRLLTLVGIGGIGKTRLALELAYRQQTAGRFRDGVWLVQLQAQRDPNLLPASIAHALKLGLTPNASASELVLNYLAHKEVLLVLDNFEQIIEAANFVGQLVGSCPDLKIVVTSREVLRLEGEQEFSVPPLPLPQLSQPLLELVANPAVELLTERVRLIQPDFEITPANSAPVAELCQLTEGLPLALGLAASRLKLFNVGELVTQLKQGSDGRLKLLARESRNVTPRHQTMRAMLEWSYNLLDAEEQAVFVRLGLFAGSFDLRAVAAVCELDEIATLDALASLMDKSLLQATDPPASTSEARFILLEVVREFALDRLTAAGRKEATEQLFVSHFTGLAQALKDKYRRTRSPEWLRQLESDRHNYRTILIWSLQEPFQADRLETGMLLMSDVEALWLAGGRHQEAQGWLQQFIQAADGLNLTHSSGYSRVHSLMGVSYNFQGRYHEALSHLEIARAIFEDLGDKRNAASATGNLAIATLSLSDYQKSLEYFQQSARLGRELDEPTLVARSLNNMSGVYIDQNNYQAGQKVLEESRSWYQKGGDKLGEAIATYNLSMTAYERGYLQQGEDYIQQSLPVLEQLNDTKHLLQAKTNQAILKLLRAEYPAADAIFTSILETAQMINARRTVADAQLGLGLVARFQGEMAQAQELYEESLLISREMGEVRLIGMGLIYLSQVLAFCGQYEASQRVLDESREVWHGVGNRGRQVELGLAQAELYQLQGRDDEAVQHFSEALELAEKLEKRTDVIIALHTRPLSLMRQNRFDEAEADLRQAIALSQAIGYRRGLLYGWLGMAGLASRRGDFKTALPLFADVKAACRVLGISEQWPDRPYYQTLLQSGLEKSSLELPAPGAPLYNLSDLDSYMRDAIAKIS